MDEEARPSTKRFKYCENSIKTIHITESKLVGGLSKYFQVFITNVSKNLNNFFDNRRNLSQSFRK